MGGHNEGIGRAGEYLCAYRLELAGVRVAHVDVSGHDLWCRTPSGRLVSVQVKATARSVLDSNGRLCYNFTRRVHENGPEVDVYGFVALDLGLVIFERDMRQRRRIAIREFTVGAMEASVARFFR